VTLPISWRRAVGIPSTLELLVKAGAREVKEERPRPASGAPPWKQR